jgi:CspA family cold shock protein
MTNARRHNGKGKMATGVIKRYFEERGFGFIKPDGAGEDVFFHVKSFDEHGEPHVGDRVEYELGADPKSGRTRAQNLALI